MHDYLIQRRGVWHYSRRVPAKLAAIIGTPAWRETTGTGDLTTARRVAAQINADHEAEIAAALIEYRRQRSAAFRLTREEREVVEAAGGLSALRKKTLGTPPTTLDRRRPGALRDAARYAEAAADMLSAADPAEGVFDPDELQVQLAEAEGLAAALRKQLDRNFAILRKGTEDEADDAELASSPASAPEADLQTIVERWAHESEAPAQHVEQYGYAVKRFNELHGRPCLKGITRGHLRDFKDALARLPRSTRADLRKANLHTAIRIAEREDLQRITEKTAQKHVTALATLLSHAVGWGYLETSPADGLRFVKVRKKRALVPERPGFTPAQLRALDTSLAKEYDDTSDDRWIPIVAAYQACRQEEVCQLSKSDIIEHTPGLWTMSITDAGEGQKVKNQPSVRTIPIHPALIARGFLSHVERSPGPLVFSSLKPDQRGRLGGPYGKRFARHLRTRAKLPGMVFHDTRHAWKTAARNALVPQEIQRAIMGHRQEDGVAEDYGVKQGPQVLAGFLAKVDPFA